MNKELLRYALYKTTQNKRSKICDFEIKITLIYIIISYKKAFYNSKDFNLI